jgi:hypothetical protein
VRLMLENESGPSRLWGREKFALNLEIYSKID